MYSYSGKAKIKFSDTFTDPLSVIEIMYGSSTSEQVADWLATVANLGGIPFKYKEAIHGLIPAYWKSN